MSAVPAVPVVPVSPAPDQVAAAAALEAVRSPSRPAAMRQLLLDLGPPDVPGLDAFLPGENAALLSWLRDWPGVSGPLSPVYLWGESGAGKTHLLRAMVERALGLGFGVIWLNAQTCQMWDAELPGAPTLALIDDCERLDAEAQHLAFKLFIEAAAAPSFAGEAAEPVEEGHQAPIFILAAGRTPAVDLPVRDDLRTRLGWGLSFAVHALDEAGVRQALRNEAERRGLGLSDEVLGYLLTRQHRDLGHLMRLLARLDQFALSEHRALTIPLIKDMLACEPT